MLCVAPRAAGLGAIPLPARGLSNTDQPMLRTTDLLSLSRLYILFKLILNWLHAAFAATSQYADGLLPTISSAPPRPAGGRLPCLPGRSRAGHSFVRYTIKRKCRLRVARAATAVVAMLYDRCRGTSASQPCRRRCTSNRINSISEVKPTFDTVLLLKF